LHRLLTMKLNEVGPRIKFFVAGILSSCYTEVSVYFYRNLGGLGPPSPYPRPHEIGTCKSRARLIHVKRNQSGSLVVSFCGSFTMLLRLFAVFWRFLPPSNALCSVVDLYSLLYRFCTVLALTEFLALGVKNVFYFGTLIHVHFGTLMVVRWLLVGI
jgi:hypothetical protein